MLGILGARYRSTSSDQEVTPNLIKKISSSSCVCVLGPLLLFLVLLLIVVGISLKKIWVSDLDSNGCSAVLFISLYIEKFIRIVGVCYMWLVQ